MTPEVTNLEQVEAAYAAAFRTGTILREWVSRYPRFAVELARLDRDLSAPTESVEPDEATIAAARTAMLEAGRAALGAPPPSPVSPGILARAKALGIAPDALARAVHLDVRLAYSIDRGFVELATLPARLVSDLREVLRIPASVDGPGFTGRPQPALFSAAVKPQDIQQTSFADAVNASTLSDEDRAWWRQVIEDEKR
jgi:hypothetical protein